MQIQELKVKMKGLNSVLTCIPFLLIRYIIENMSETQTS